MGTLAISNPIISVTGDLTGYAQKVMAQAAAMAAQGPVADKSNLWPMQLLGAADRKILAGTSNIEAGFHQVLQGGQFLERNLGDAMSEIQKEKKRIEDNITHWLGLNRLAIDGQLSDHPRAIKFIADSIQFVDEIQKCIKDTYALVAAMQANIQMLLAIEQRMLQMIQANINSIANLLSEICNWGLPSLLSMVAQLGNLFHFNGFNFNLLAGFNILNNLNLKPNLTFGFSFNQCIKRSANFSGFFGTLSNMVNADVSTLTFTVPSPLGGYYGDPNQFTAPDYIAKMRATSTPVFNPNVAASSSSTPSSLPAPASIISNYALTPASYESNIVSIVPALQPAMIQPSTLRSQLLNFVTLGDVVASNYDPNTTAAWLFYLNLNRTGRGGQWISAYETAYQSLVTPSLNYLAATPVPWNQVLGSTTMNDSPPTIPLIPTLQADTTRNLLWKLSYVEASLLGYPRNSSWDAGADTLYTSSFTQAAFDYLSTPLVAGAPTTTTMLGVGTAAYPVSATYPTAIAGNLTQVIALATVNIANTPSYQSNRPQFRFTYDMFAQATLVDRYSQFWRDFNANLVSLLAQDPYVISYVVSYVATLNGAVNPLADQTAYNQLEADAISRNRTWSFGSNLPLIPEALVNTASYPSPTAENNGWTSGTLNATAFLSRPDIQAQTLPVQIAMLRTNQSYASLLSTQANVQSAVSDALAQANAGIQSIGLSGWSMETNAVIAVQPGATGQTVAFGQTDFDQTGYIQDSETVVVPQSNTFIVTASLAFDPTGSIGTRTVNLLQNGVVQATAYGDNTSIDPFTVQFSTIMAANTGDILQIQVLHSLPTSQNLLVGSSFMGLIDVSATPTNTTVIPSAPASLDGSTGFNSGTAFPVLSAVFVGSDGNIYPINPASTAVGQIPLADGIALAASTAAGEAIQVAVVYGARFPTVGTTWMPGGLLYVGADGTLTQDYATISTTVRWIVCIGRAVTATSFIYEPHIPTNYVQKF